MGKVCLVLEGGGNRGIYTSGVLDAFMDNDVHIKDVYGVSAGALNALSYLSNQKGRSFRLNKEYMYNKESIDYKRVFLGAGILNLDYILKEVNLNMDPLDLNTFHKNNNFVTVSTNIVTGAPVYKKIEDYNKDLEYIKASASLPLFSNVVHVDGLKLLDGGLSDSIPVIKALDDGYDKVIVVCTRNRDFICRPYKFMNAYRAKYLKYRTLIKTMENRADKYNVTRDLIDDLVNKGKVLAIYPSELLIIKHIESDFNKIDYAYNLGYNDALKRIEDIKKFIGD